jgi:hypothetical protein
MHLALYLIFRVPFFNDFKYNTVISVSEGLKYIQYPAGSTIF